MFKSISKSIILLGIIFTLVLGLSYGAFIYTSDSYRATEMLISNLIYGIDITSTGGSETIKGNTVSLTSGNTSTVLLKVTSLNKIISKYGVDYKITSGTGSVKYASNTGWLPIGKINENNVGTFEKSVKVVIEAETDMSVDFTVTGGFQNNDLTEVKSGYTRVTEIYDGIVDYKEDLKSVISKETTGSTYGGEAINNYLQYPTNIDVTKNLWRVLGYYSSVGGIKVISNLTSTTTQNSIASSLTTFYNTLEKQDDYVLETDKFNCDYISCTSSTYSNIGLLSVSEYDMLGGVNSYLASNGNYFALDNNIVKNITPAGIEETSTTSGLRPTIYLQSDVKVTGSGTQSDPYRLSEKGDVILASATLNGIELESFPKESDPYIPKTVSCTNGSEGVWDTEAGKIKLTTVNLPTSCVVDFTEGYIVTLNATNGTVTAPVSKTVERNETTIFTVTPNDGYLLEIEEDNCSGTLSGNTYLVTDIDKSKTCTIAFKKNTLYRKLLKDNPTIKTRTDFSVTLEDTNTNVLYVTTEDNTKVYYFAGNAQNNWVKFGGYYWRIIRTNKDGSIRLLYFGTTYTGDISGMDTGAYNTSMDEARYAGYMYGTSGSLENNRLNTTSSVVKTAIDNWYLNNLYDNYRQYISNTAIYCNDRESTYGSFMLFAGYNRLSDQTKVKPSYDCANTKDAFSGVNTEALLTCASDSSKICPLALITADELSYAGGTYFSGSTAVKPWYYVNGNNATLSSSSWTMTPGTFSSSGIGFFTIGWNGGIGGNTINSTARINRPVLSLKSCVRYKSGDGSTTSPYEIEETTSGC